MNKKDYLDPFDSIREWLYCLVNFIDLNIDLNLDKNKKEISNLENEIYKQLGDKNE